MRKRDAPGWHDRRALLASVAIAGPIIAIAATWLPLILHYRVDALPLSASHIEELRRVPGDEVLEQLYRAGHVMTALHGSQRNTVVAANEILQGTYRTLAGDAVTSDIAASADQLMRIAPTAQFEMSCQAVTQVLVEAYRRTLDSRYLKSALESTLAWARLSRTAGIPTGYLWNDHALVSRMVVLTELWRQYRNHVSYDSAAAAELLTFASQTAALLSADSHYTMRTNHGVMQNTALLHFAAAFPAVPGNREMVANASRRLESHLPYYVSDSGVVLEHSAGYQDFGIQLLHSWKRYVELLALPEPAGLQRSLEAARCFRRHITRHDGSIPVYGDTYGTQPVSAPGVLFGSERCEPAAATWIDHEFGYASMHEFAGPSSQLFLTWASFPGRAHKHDDELAVWMWQQGRDWWGASGYWPYDDATRDQAVSWRGSNAPHAVGEPTGLASESRLVGLVDDHPVRLLDLERRSFGDGNFRRQVIGIAGAGVLVLDSATGSADGADFETVWTLEPGVKLRRDRSRGNAYELSTPDGRPFLRLRLTGGERLAAAIEPPARSTFAGLVARYSKIVPTVSLVVTSGIDSWSLMHWRADPDRDVTVDTPWQVDWVDAEHWSIPVEGERGLRELRRDGNRITLRDAVEGEQSFAIEPGIGARPKFDRAVSLFRDNAERYPPFRTHMLYRNRASLGVGLLFIVQWIAFWFLGRLGMGNGQQAVATAAGWIACSTWLHFQYLA